MPDRCPECHAPLAPRAPVCPGCGCFVGDAPHPTGAAAPAHAPPARSRPAPASTPAPAPGTEPASGLQRPPAADGASDATPRPPFPATLAPFRQRLRDTFGYPDFRDGQAHALEALGDGDVLAVMPTGSGKSLCYVLPALELGRAVVVSPLIALMQDQVEGLRAAGVSATFINSNLGRDEQNQRYIDFVAGRTALLFVAPERFGNAAFTNGLRRHGVNLLAIDEAHCISEWGHNFRPDYLQLGTVRERLGSPRTLALTATANPHVRRDILQRLGIAGSAREVVTTVDRPNLTYGVEPIDSLTERRRWVVDYVRARRGLAGIVYVRTRRGVEDLADELQRAGLQAEAYHAGLDRQRRARVQRAFTTGDLPVIVATNAFGMGIDKPDVRYVIHLNMPGRLEAYYQEAGRAGRDGEPAECTLLYARADRRAQQRLIDEAHPGVEQVRDTWRRWIRLAEPGTGRLPHDLGQQDPDGYAITVSALRDSGLLDPVALRVTSFDAEASIDISAIERHRAFAEGRLRDMAEYAETDGCRRAIILRYFGEEATDRCEACDNCLQRRTPGIDSDSAAYPSDLYEEIVELRAHIARESDRDPYLVFENRTAREIATYRPRSMDALLDTWGIGDRRAAWFGRRILQVIDDWEDEHPEAAPPPEPPPTRDRTRRGGVAEDPMPVARAAEAVRPDDPLYVALRQWRTERARSEGVPAYTIFSDRTLRELVAVRPRNVHALLRIWGLGEARVDRFGAELVDVIREQPAAE